MTDEEAPFAAARFQLAPGSIPPLYTDGFLSPRRDDVKAALDRLLRALSQHDRQLNDLRDNAVCALRPVPNIGGDAILLLAQCPPR